MKVLGDHDQLQARLDRYRSLFEEAPVAYLVTDRFGVVSDANRRAAGLLGRRRARSSERKLVDVARELLARR